MVIDGLVHKSEGILPAWEAGADASGLEDLRTLWNCPGCHAFDWTSLAPEACPHCGHPLDVEKVLRPAAALREALAERLGVEPSEIVPTAGGSAGPSGEDAVSAFLHDIAAGGAGLSARMAETEILARALARVIELLERRRGCPACILRPDLNSREVRPDRPGALALARALKDWLNLPDDLRVFGPGTRLAGLPAAALVATRLRQGRLSGLDLWLHGDPAAWHLADWPIRPVLQRLAKAGIRPRIGMAATALAAAGLTLDRKLGLHGLAQAADLHLVDDLPKAGNLPILLHLHGSSCHGIAVAEQDEAVPAEGWELGAGAPSLIGPTDVPAPGRRFSAARLVELGTGNARLLWSGQALDGPAAGFAQRFWDWLAHEAPLEVGAMRAAGAESLHYSDRDLLQAHTVRCLADVMRGAPGAKEARLIVDLAPDDRHPAIRASSSQLSRRKRPGRCPEGPSAERRGEPSPTGRHAALPRHDR